MTLDTSTATVVLIRIWPGTDPLPVAPMGWTEVTTLEDGSILCALVASGAWKYDHWQPSVVVGEVQVP